MSVQGLGQLSLFCTRFLDLKVYNVEIQQILCGYFTPQSIIHNLEILLHIRDLDKIKLTYRIYIPRTRLNKKKTARQIYFEIRENTRTR